MINNQRKQKGKIRLKKRVNITYPSSNTMAIIVKKNINLTTEQFKIMKLDLTKSSTNFKFYFTIVPNKPITKKGILVRMGKGKGKIVTYKASIPSGNVLILIKPSNNNFEKSCLTSFFKKYPFLSFKSF